MAAARSARTVRKGGIDWWAAVLAGLVAGAIFAGIEVALDFLFLEGTVGGRLRMVAAIVLGEGVLPPPDGLDVGLGPEILLVTIGIHLSLSVVYAVVLAWLVFRLRVGPAELLGAGFGVAMYLINFYGFALLFPWFAVERGWVNLLLHVIFGLVAAFEYKALARRARERRVDPATGPA